MAFFSWSAVAFSAAVTGAAYILVLIGQFLLQTRRPKNYPPGPPILLGLGNLHQMPLQRPFLKFHEWSKIYGDIVGLKMGPKNMIIIFSPEYVRELFQKRGAKYSGRPHATIPLEHIIKPEDKLNHILWMQDDSRLRRWRTAARHILGSEGVERVMPLQAATAQKLAYSVLHDTDPDAYTKHSHEWSLATPLLALTGQRIEEFGPGFVESYQKAQHDWLDFLDPGTAPPIDIFPALEYIPAFIATWKAKALFVQKSIYGVYFNLLNAAKDKMSIGRLNPETVFGNLLREQGSKKFSGFTDNEMAFLGGGLLDAAVDTTLASMANVLLCLVGHPAKMRKAQEEIDSVCPDKCPQPEDLRKMPYLRACLTEALRWRTVATLGLPHLVTEDDEFHGYTIPKGSTVLACTYSIHLRSEDYDNPEEFRPERYVNNPYGTKSKRSTTQEQAEEGRRPTYAFGVGRRGCPGEEFAMNALQIAAAKLLWAFDISCEGTPDMSWETGYAAGLVTAPKGFNPRFAVRSAQKKEAVERDYHRSEEYLKETLG